MDSYAIVQTGGKQYRVVEGDTLKVERLEGKAGEEVKLSDVLYIRNDGKSFAGRPTVSGAAVTAEVLRHVRAPKIIVFKQHRKKVYRKTQGHRQTLTELRIKHISIPKI